MPQFDDLYSVSLEAAIVLLGIAYFGQRLFRWWSRWREGRAPWIAVDGSNVLYWQDEIPSLQTVREVVDALKRRGMRPVVWFDANVGYLVGDRYLGPVPLAKSLGLSERQVIVAPKGTPADPLVIEGARLLKSRIVSNDRFRDWQDQYPAVREAMRFLRGSIENGALRLDE
ncbi:MAG: hypothetical protein EBT91_11415 [Rhodobacteraceae bacterium]|nr:hypothetical protein [Paracoccaceae bacterium]